jgi:hypothetical protein
MHAINGIIKVVRLAFCSAAYVWCFKGNQYAYLAEETALVTFVASPRNGFFSPKSSLTDAQGIRESNHLQSLKSRKTNNLER